MWIYVLKTELFKIPTKIHLIRLVFYAGHEYGGDFMHRPPGQKLLAVKAQKLDFKFSSSFYSNEWVDLKENVFDLSLRVTSEPTVVP